jgi:hypothetical protein
MLEHFNELAKRSNKSLETVLALWTQANKTAKSKGLKKAQLKNFALKELDRLTPESKPEPSKEKDNGKKDLKSFN